MDRSEWILGEGRVNQNMDNMYGYDPLTIGSRQLLVMDMWF
jgi:hypothetical protein